MNLRQSVTFDGTEEVKVHMIKQNGRTDWPLVTVEPELGRLLGPHQLCLQFENLEAILAFGRKIVNEAESIQSDINRAELEKACLDALAAEPEGPDGCDHNTQADLGATYCVKCGTEVR